MWWSDRISQPPQQEPVSLPEARSHLRVTGDDEDALIQSLIVAAREWCERFQQRAYVTQTRRLTIDRWPRIRTIHLPCPPLQSVERIAYTDADGEQHEMDAAGYMVDTDAEPGRIVLARGSGWPAGELRPASGVAIVYVAGYGAPEAVPQRVKQAILLLVGHWYEHREGVLTGSISKEIEFSVNALLAQDRVWYGSPEVW